MFAMYPAGACAGLIGSPVLVCSGGAFWPATCYNEAADEFLVLWVDVTDPNGWQLKARRFDSNLGVPVGSEFYISPDPASVKAIVGAAAYNPTNGEWFVVYQGTIAGVSNGEDDVLAQRVSSAGSKVGGHIVLVSKPGYQNSADVAYDPDMKHYLVVWTEKIGARKQVMGRFFDVEGRPLSPELCLRDSTAAYDSHNPHVVYNPIAREFFVVWQDYRNYIGSGQDNEYSDIYAQRINASTRTLVGANIPVYWGGSPYTPNGQDIPLYLVCNTRDGRYLMVIQKLTSTEYYRTCGLVVDYTGSWSGSGFFDISRPNFGVPTGAVYHLRTNTYFVTYEDLTEGHANTVWGRQFSSDGVAVSGHVEVNAAPGGVRGGCLAIRPSDGQCVQFVDTDAGGKIYAQRYVCDYVPGPPGPPAIINPSSNSAVEGPGVLIRWTGEWHDMFEIHINTSNVPDDGSVYDSGPVSSSSNCYKVGPLQANSAYFVFVRLRNDFAGWGEWSSPGVCFRVVPNIIPPGAPEDVSVVGTNGAVTIAWTNPTDNDLAGIVIRARGDRCPRSLSDGELVADIRGAGIGVRQSFRHSPVANGIARYYAVFAYDEGGLVSSPVCERAAAEAWQVEYHAETLPSASVPSWLVFEDGGSEVWAFVDPAAGVLHVADTATSWGSKIRWYRNWNASSSVGVTVSVRARCDNASVGVNTSNVTLAHGLRYINFAILPDRVAARPDGVSYFDREYALDGTSWHTYRFTLKDASYACYVDDNPVPVFTGVAYPTATNAILFGVNGSLETQSIYFDYVLYRTTGASGPVSDSDGITEAKFKPDESPVSLAGVCVTACYNGFFYVASDEGLEGIRVVKSGYSASVGQRADIRGVIRTNSAGERYIAASTVVVR